MRKMVILHSLAPELIERLQAAVPDWEIVCGKNKDIWQRHLPEAEIIVGWNQAAMEGSLERADSKLRWVQGWGAGVDKMPLSKFAERGVLLTNASGVHAYPISETIFAMMLSFARNLHGAIRNQTNKVWSSSDNVMGEIHGKTIGIVGVGAIGEETARLAKAFGMHVLGVRRSGEPLPCVDRMLTIDKLDEVLEVSDYLVVTIPLTTETRHLFGKAQFDRMKQGAVFINIGRGATVDTDELIAALQSGRLAGAGLDVFEQEPLPETSPLWEMSQVIMTPHNAGATNYYNERAMDILIRNLQDYLQGREPSLNRVDLDKQY